MPIYANAQTHNQIIPGFKMYENYDKNIRIQYPNNWEQINKHPPDAIVKFIAPDKGDSKETGVLISTFNRPSDRSLDEFINFFHKYRYVN